MSRLRKISGWVLAAAAVGAGSLFAVAQARVHGSITDEQGRPVAGVKIIVTLPEIPSFRAESASDEKGNYALTLVDATRTYSYRFEKEGYQALEMTLKVPVNSNEKHDFKMLTMQAAMAGADASRALTDSDKAVLAFNEGAASAQQGDTQTARKRFEDALALNPQLAAAWTALATLAYGDQQYAVAVENAEKARALDAKDVRALRILVEAYGQLGDAPKAKAASEALAALDPKAGAADFYNRGIKEYNAGNMEAAFELFEKSLAGDPTFAKTHYMLGMCHVNRGESADARQHFETFIAMAPDDPDAATAKEMLNYIK